MKKWITFDLDGTLMQNPFGKWVFPEVEELISQQLKQPYKSTEALVREHERRMKENRTVEAYDWDEMVRELIGELKLELAIDVEQLVLKHSAAPKIYLLEEAVIPVLKQLKVQGYSLATVTNGFYKYQYPVMKELGISEWFEEIVTPELAGCGKPNEQIFDGLRKSGEIVAHVGDRLDHDVYMANKTNVPSIFIYRQLPEALRALTPRERSTHADFAPLLRKKLVSEDPAANIDPLSESYIPTHVICTLDELAGCLE
ncbi:HAD family hydrolase [Paenibacillus thalictri]|nr:HAD family hydrolase [Paenibacillus thalictri]